MCLAGGSLGRAERVGRSHVAHRPPPGPKDLEAGLPHAVAVAVARAAAVAQLVVVVSEFVVLAVAVSVALAVEGQEEEIRRQEGLQGRQERQEEAVPVAVPLERQKTAQVALSVILIQFRVERREET